MISCLVATLAMNLPAKSSTQAIIAESWKRTLVVGHRGAAAYKPENSLPAFEEGIASLASAVECDIHLSRDGQIVVMHDKTLDRTTSLKGAVAETDLAAMKAAGVPSLSDLTKVTKDRTVLVVEIKHGDGIEKKMIDHLNAEQMLDQTILFSFGENHIRKSEEIDARYFSVLLVGRALKPEQYEETLDHAKSLGADGIGFQFLAVTPELVKAAHNRKVPVFVWTVPPGPQIDRLKGLGVNFIITDHPRHVRAQLGL